MTPAFQSRWPFRKALGRHRKRFQPVRTGPGRTIPGLIGTPWWQNFQNRDRVAKVGLALIEEDLGIEVALQAARELVVFFKRPGGQSQFSTLLSGQIADAKGPLKDLLAWIADNLRADLRAETLADRAGMSLRTFARSCVEHTGMTPGKLVESLRVETARDAIEKSDTPLDSIAARYGFGDEQRMRRAFVRQVRATPSDIRTRFGR
jgi:transcriptional regulator GlxA family with amidase domain